MDEVGQNGEFIPRLYVVRCPVIRQFVARVLAGHPLLNPFFAATMFLPRRTSTFEAQSGIRHFLHPLVADLRQPELDRFGFRTRHALHQPQQSLGIGDVGEIVFAVGGGQFQLVTICHQLTTLLGEAVLQDFPIISRRPIVSLLREHLDDVHDREPPRLGLLIVDTANFMLLKKGGVVLHGGEFRY